MSIAVSWNDSHIGATLAVKGLGDGGNERLLVHSDCFNVTSWRGRAGSGSEGALLDWTAWVDRAPLGQGGAVYRHCASDDACSDRKVLHVEYEGVGLMANGLDLS